MVVLGLLIAGGYKWMAFDRHAQGKELFLARQEHRFDRYYVDPGAEPMVRLLVTAIVASGLIVGAYELLAFGIYRIICLVQAREDTPERT